jgi:hypothetical protein
VSLFPTFVPWKAEAGIRDLKSAMDGLGVNTVGLPGMNHGQIGLWNLTAKLTKLLLKEHRRAVK